MSRRRIMAASLAALFVTTSCGSSAPSSGATPPPVTFEMWSFDGTGWTPHPGPATPARQSPAVAYDSRHRVVVMFGGIGGADTWTWDGRAWARQHPRVTPEKTVGAMFYDEALGEVVFVDELVEAWAWDGKDWRRIAVQGAPQPLLSGGTHISAGYDPEVGGLVVLANNWTTSPPRSTYDTWSWNGSVWTRLGEQVYELNRGPDSANGELVYDPGDKRFVSVGNGSSSATWAWSGRSWSDQLQPFGSGGPAAYDAPLGGIVTVTICIQAAASCGSGQTVWLDRFGTWSEISVRGQQRPVDVEAMTFDAAQGELVVMGCSTLVCSPQ